ncbi:LIM and senescent cell antigen-like-containing domain protein 1 isoform X1 [Pristis pectinata]|uniref:LIM and senescent cell antigen-like-containing domain protein 1 isoform X1 n=1 Tax=Pristis pectinata TaxID=685728 RepID=UPI00223E2CD1|nr:LIM and senescent cell antigen-like-containing domain protein 1 isoform X1 [Pristis pectinata]
MKVRNQHSNRLHCKVYQHCCRCRHCDKYQLIKCGAGLLSQVFFFRKPPEICHSCSGCIAHHVPDMNLLQLKELSQSDLYRRRQERHDSFGTAGLETRKLSNMANALANAMCERCKSGFAPAERIVNSNGELYHEQCFVCAQCFQQFPEGLFYEFEGRKYCEHDFQMLFAPCCHQCGEFIIGRVIKAMNNSWHPECFCCDLCQQILADIGFVKNAGRHLCRPCHNREKARGLGKYICQKCHAIIDEQPLIFKNDPYHPDHFNCVNCGKELTAEARELKGELYCLPCHDKMGVPICGACRRPIEGRVVNAMGKQWHVEHFVCAKCEKPFLGHRHYERKGLAYCETHYNQLFGDVCYHCNRVIEGDVVSALNKAWCVNCFACSTCNTKLTLKNKFVEFDMKPVCKKCYEKFPLELKKRLKKLAESAGRK